MQLHSNQESKKVTGVLFKS